MTNGIHPGQASSQTTLFFVCRGTDPDPYLDMRLVAVVSDNALADLVLPA